jgi:hypothetical protein
MSEMSVLNRKGDSKILWSFDNADEVANAKRSFEDMTKKGFSAFRVKRDGSSSVRMDEFDPEAEKVVLVPPVVGGA